MAKLHPEIDCKQTDCPYYGHYVGDSNDKFYKGLGLTNPLINKKEIDCIIRSTCHLCIYFPSDRRDMKSFVIKEKAKRLLIRE